MMATDTFEQCHSINDLLHADQEREARDQLIRLLDTLKQTKSPYSPLINHLIRETGLYPYLEPETAAWSDRFTYEAFKVDVGEEKSVTLHREQSRVLSYLLAGTDLAVSAPTSFGKSFIIDAFIAIQNPNNVVLIVPTIALTDETRRRLTRKFGHRYKIITTSNIELQDKNIFIFPQERALQYLAKIDDIDLLIIDEFYKASKDFDKERAPALINVLLRFGKKARQRYFLAPHIARLNDNPFTRSMKFLPLDFNTVFLEQHHLYGERALTDAQKSEALLRILNERNAKTLIYAGSLPNIEKIGNLIITEYDTTDNKLLNDFANWLETYYQSNWNLAHLIRRKTGIHNGQIHRALSQLQIDLFNKESDGLKNIISTSSIIEGVNTAAEDVVLWRNKLGTRNLSDFAYKNIIGRGGRMFRHFIGNVFILEPPPESKDTQLDLDFPDELLASLDEHEFKDDLSDEQQRKIISYKKALTGLLGSEKFNRIMRENLLQTNDYELALRIAGDIAERPGRWRGLGYLNSDDVNSWDHALYELISLNPGGWDSKYSKFVAFVKALASNWNNGVLGVLRELEDWDISIDEFFRLERNITFKLSALAGDVNTVRRLMTDDHETDISPFVWKASHAFLPPLVYYLEEYGLPRSLARKISQSGVYDLTTNDVSIDTAIAQLKKIGPTQIEGSIRDLHPFDRYILNYFFAGI